MWEKNDLIGDSLGGSQFIVLGSWNYLLRLTDYDYAHICIQLLILPTFLQRLVLLHVFPLVFVWG